MKLFSKIRKWLRWENAREGSSLVTVIIGVTFLLTIGLVVLTVSTKYLSSVYVDRNSTDNFYEAEGILEEVKTGLLTYAGESADEAYSYILSHFSDTATENKKTLFAKMYLGLLEKRLKNSPIPSLKTAEEDFGNQFAGTYFKDFDDRLGTLQNCGGSDEIKNQVKKLSTKPEAVQLVDNNIDGYQYRIDYDSAKGYYLTLKNLLIKYKDEDTDYRSSIQADIVLTVPDYKFEGDSLLEEIRDYVSISDDILSVESGVATNPMTITGNVYSGGTAKATAPENTEYPGVITSEEGKDAGIVVGLDKYVNFKSQKIISRGSLDILPGASVKINGESGFGDLWLNNIRLTYGGFNEFAKSSSLNIKANSYISNDLNIETDNADVTLGGKYYGYSYSSENGQKPDTTAVPAPLPSAGLYQNEQRSDFSSAILINGKNTALKADSSLDKLILAGRAFVSRNNEGGTRAETASDIMMGESLAVKSNQLAYLVPDECIKIQDSSEEGHNPTASTENIDEDFIKTSLLSNELFQEDGKSLLDEDEPFVKDYSNTGGYVFFYLNFKDGLSANKYFRQFYLDTADISGDGSNLTNKEQIEERAKAYISGTDADGMKIDPAFYLVAGNIIRNYNSGEESGLLSGSDDFYKADGAPNSALLADGYKQGCDYVGLQSTLAAGGSSGSMRLGENTAPIVAGKIIDFSKMSSAKGSLPNPVTIYSESGINAEVQLIDSTTGSEVEITHGLVIAAPDVTVQVNKNFTGLILAGGKVETGAAVINMKSDMVMVGKILEKIQEDASFAPLTELFRGMNGSVTTNPTSLDQCASYENWKKNAI